MFSRAALRRPASSKAPFSLVRLFDEQRFADPLNRERIEWACRCGNPKCGLELIAETAELAAWRWNRRARWAQLANHMYRSKTKS